MCTRVAALFVAALTLVCVGMPALAANTATLSLSVVPAATAVAPCTPIAIGGEWFVDAISGIQYVGSGFVCAKRPALVATTATAPQP